VGVWRGVCDQDVSVWGDSPGPGIVLWVVCESVLGGEGDDGGDLGGAVDG
jgi:hypothetical protein